MVMVHPETGNNLSNNGIASVWQAYDAKRVSISHEDESAKAFALVYGADEADDTEIQSFHGFFAPLWKKCTFYLLAILSLGLSLLIARWSPRVYIWLRLSPCSLGNAQYVLIKLEDGRMDLDKVVKTASSGPQESLPAQKDVENCRGNLLEWQRPKAHSMLEYRCSRYFYTDSLKTFVPVPAIPKGFNEQLQQSALQLTKPGKGLQIGQPQKVLEQRFMRYGSNEMCIPVKTIAQLIFNEMWHPFYVFQYFSIVVWVAGDQYYSYAVCIFAITWFSIISSAMESNSNMRRLADIAHFETDVEVLRGGAFISLPSSQLVPGDVVVVKPGSLPCDAVLLRGECIVDENMLTGESVPVRKVPYSPSADGLQYQPDKNVGCTLFGGTRVAQARGTRNQKAVAMVCRTGFCSAKGQLLRSILFPREHEQSFVSDSLKFIIFMLTGCMALYIWAAVVLHSIGATNTRIMVRFFDMITIAVPPALPACLTIATVFSIARFRKRDVYVTSPDRIAMAGQLDVICFDKTGTLTEQGLDLQGIIPVSGGHFQAMSEGVQQLPEMLQQLLASCHGLAHMDGVLVGDPLDQKLFQATHWEMIDVEEEVEEQRDGEIKDLPGSEDASARSGAGSETLLPSSSGSSPVSGRVLLTALGEAAHLAAVKDGGDEKLPLPQGLPHQQQHHHHHMHTYVRPPGGAQSFSILKRFEFSSALQRNMVAVQAPGGAVSVFVKGSPEVIRNLVAADSVPPDFDSVLGSYTREGLRVLALAQGDASQVPVMELAQWSQEEMERRVPLALVGLAVMANPLRADSAEVVQKLQDASIRTVMVTGDHLRTAISVAHLCHILPTGKPIVLVDANDTASGSGAFQLSVLELDGSVTKVSLPASTVVKVATGELECAVTGKGFTRLLETLDSELLLVCLRHASVYARMSPDNKRDLMELLGGGMPTVESCPHLGLHVGFCGDGANDCGALKAAHVGVSLCEAEASVAAPMTSKNQTTASMLTVVAEGRCSLMATFQIFQFIIGYALVQAFETNLMYTYALNVGNYQYLIQDLFFTTVLAALMGYTEPRSKLSRQKPLNRVMSLPLLVSTLLQLVVVMAFQLASLWLLSMQPGYERTQGPTDLRLAQAPENTTTYIMALAQFIILALVFNKGRPHRSPLYTNYGLLLALTAQVSFVLFTLYSDDAFNLEVQELVGKDGVMDDRFRTMLLLLICANGVAAFAMERLSAGLVGLICWLRPPKPSRLRFAASRAAQSGSSSRAGVQSDVQQPLLAAQAASSL